MSSSGWKLPAIGWWLAAFIFLACQLSTDAVIRCSLVEPLHVSVMTDSTAWNPPLSYSATAQAWGQVPPWLLAVFTATLIAWVAARIGGRCSPWLAGIVLIGLSLSALTDQFVSATLVTIAGSLAFASHRPRNRIGWCTALACVLGVAVLTTVEFGLVAFVILFALASNARPSEAQTPGRSWRRLVPTGLIALPLLFACIREPAFLHALMRPLTATLFAVNSQILPGLEPSFSRATDWPAIAGLLVIAVAALWATRKGLGIGALMVILLFGAIGMTCKAYLWLALVGASVVHFSRSATDAAASNAKNRRLTAILQVVCVLLATGYLQMNTKLPGDIIAATTAQSRVVDTSSWPIEGPILLTNLNHADDWKGPLEPSTTTLLMDDRWDAGQSKMLEYIAACQDLMAGRQHSYRRSDGSWGGYARFITEWDPAIVVLDSEHLQAIRRLSVDPNWNVLSIDARRTIFGNPASPQVRTQARKAGELFYFLEWPKQQAPASPEGVLELGTPSDAQKVAAVFNAIRLPYAALRALPQNDLEDSDFVRTWSYVELAHRALRQTGRPSLLDQSRAIVGASRLADEGALNAGRQRLVQEWLASVRDHPVTMFEIPDEVTSEEEQKLRIELAAGQLKTARTILQRVNPKSVRRFYAAIESSCTQTPLAAFELLQLAIEDPEFPMRLKSEALFYLGCLSLELRNPEEAASYFVRSRNASLQSPLVSLQTLYLRQLGVE